MTARRKGAFGLYFFIFCILLLLAGGVLLAAFTSYQPKIRKPELTGSDWAAGGKVFNTLLNAAMKSKRPADVALLTLTPDQVNGLLNLAMNGESLMALLGMRSPGIKVPDRFEIQYRQGWFDFKVQLTDSVAGFCLLAKGSARPTVSPEDYRLSFRRLTIGRAPWPLTHIESLAKSQLDRYQDDPSILILREIIDKVEYTPDYRIRITYHPYLLRTHLSAMLR